MERWSGIGTGIVSNFATRKTHGLMFVYINTLLGCKKYINWRKGRGREEQGLAKAFP